MAEPSGDHPPVRPRWRHLAGPRLRRVGQSLRPVDTTLRALVTRVRTAARRRGVRRVGLAIGLLVVTLAGIWIGLLVGGHTRQDVGPFSAEFTLSVSPSGGTDVQIPPLGSLELNSHDGPAHLSVRLDQLDQQRAVAVARDRDGLQAASAQAVKDAQVGVRHLIIKSVAAALLGVLILSGLVFRNWRRMAICVGLAVALLGGTGLLAVKTLNPRSVQEPTYRGLLTNAPSI